MACILHKEETSTTAKPDDTETEPKADLKIVMSKSVIGYLTQDREVKWKQEHREPEDCPLYKL